MEVKDNAKFVTNLVLKKICYNELYRGRSDCLATCVLVFEIVEGTNKRGRLCRGWTDG